MPSYLLTGAGFVIAVSVTRIAVPSIRRDTLRLPSPEAGPCAVTLLSPGRTPLQTVKIVRRVQDSDLDAALEVVRGAPSKIVSHVDVAYARAVVSAIEDAGGSAKLDGSTSG